MFCLGQQVRFLFVFVFCLFLSPTHLYVYVADDRAVPRRDQGLPLQNNPRLGGEQAGQCDLPPPDQLEVRRPGLVELDHEALGAEITQEKVIHRHLRASVLVSEKMYSTAKANGEGRVARR